MKKAMFICACALLLIACKADQEAERTEEVETEDEVVTEEEEAIEAEEVEAEEENTASKETKQQQKEGPQEKTSTQSNESKSNGKEKKAKEKNDYQHLIDMANKIFTAQKKQDFDYLESIRSSGTKIDKKNAAFTFNNVTYPHEQPFLTEEELGEIEYRFTHETDDGSVIVGFGIINYETESSFTVDFEFVKENGSWKMNDMDLNK